MESATTRILEDMALYGPGRIPIEDDPLPPDRCFGEQAAGLIETLAEMFDGVALEIHLEDMAWGLVNIFHRKVDRLERQLGDLEAEAKTLIAYQDGSEIRSVELERVTAKSEALCEHIAEFENMREAMASAFANITGSAWVPRSGARKAVKGLTAAIIDSQTFMKARKERELAALDPQGSMIAFTGGQDWTDVDAVFHALDEVHKLYPDMVLCHTAQKRGADLIALRWSQSRMVDQIPFEPEFTKFNNAAPFLRNDKMIAVGPERAVIFPGNGITANLGQKAEKAGVTVLYCGGAKKQPSLR